MEAGSEVTSGSERDARVDADASWCFLFFTSHDGCRYNLSLNVSMLWDSVTKI